MFYKALIRPSLLQFDPEDAHDGALRAAALLGRNKIALEATRTLFSVEDGRLTQTEFGIDFHNPVGLAAGYDKNALGINLWPSLGFGFVEIGSVTSRPQEGNPPPRLFRLVEQRALVNRMGFNNDGAEAILSRVPPTPHAIPIGVNIGKDRDVALDRAAGNYAETLEQFQGRADFFVLNVSSPNTPGLRKLQDREMLDDLLGGVPKETAVLLKLAPDLTFVQMDDVLALVQKHRIAGVVATNTTVNHSIPPEGGLSGAPLRSRATECVRHIRRQTQGKLSIIGVGGIFTATDAYEKIRAGASLVEVWTGMIYEGPAIARNINRGLLKLLDRDGFYNVAEAVGTE
jgi:dihydroorotate dehydrogenase